LTSETARNSGDDLLFDRILWRIPDCIVDHGAQFSFIGSDFLQVVLPAEIRQQ
jgi:hypothetical protein